MRAIKKPKLKLAEMLGYFRNMELLDAKDVKKMLRCSLAHAYALAERGDIPCVRWTCLSENGGRPKTMVRFKRQDVMDFIEKHYQG